MTTFSKVAAAVLLALAATPAFAADPEALTRAERNTSMQAAGAQAFAATSHRRASRRDVAVRALANAPVPQAETYDFSILSQH